MFLNRSAHMDTLFFRNKLGVADTIWQVLTVLANLEDVEELAALNHVGQIGVGNGELTIKRSLQSRCALVDGQQHTPSWSRPP